MAPTSLRLLLGVLLVIRSSLLLNAQTPAAAGKSDPDVLTFVNGEKLIGHLERSVGTSVTFKSDMAGEVTVEWSKIKELHSSQQFAVVKKDSKLHWHQPMDIAQGTISVADQNIQINAISPAPGSQAPRSQASEQQASVVTIPVGNAGEVIDKATFDKAVFKKPGLFEDWKGLATVGVSLVNGTQSSQNYTSAVSLQRMLPTETWLDPSSRTTLNFTSAYGQLKQPNTPLVKTSLYHASAERDHYFRPRVYGFGSAGFDHDYSQGLDLQQTYGGGVGWTAIKRANQEFDVKAELTYVDQQFFAASSNQKLLGSIFSESYDRRFRNKIVLHEQISLDPAWTILRAYSANGNVSLSMPVMGRISFTVSTADQYLNDPSPGFRKNSYQFATGLTYTLP